MVGQRQAQPDLDPLALWERDVSLQIGSLEFAVSCHQETKCQ
jgi:hypothetical protein